VPSLEEFFDEASKTLTQYAEYLGARVGRLATVVSRHARHPSPGMFLSRHFCKAEILQGPLNRPESFELHARKAYKL
jgi:hypothetical protein